MEPGEKAKIVAGLTEFINMKSKGNNSLVCTVKEINYVNFTCYCEPIADHADIQQVRLIAQQDNGFMLTPRENSVVVVSFLSDESAYISMVSEVEKVTCYIDAGNRYEFDNNGFIWNDGTFGGMAKTGVLATRLNNIENKINAILTAIGTTWVPVPNDGGAALKALFIAPLATPVTLTTQATIEDTKIKH
jgi:hypothetical protein